MRALAVALALGAASGGAGADELAARMQAYFDGEEREGFAWMGFGGAALSGGGALLAQGGDFAKGLGGALLGFGAVHELIGVYLLSYTEPRVARLERELAAEPRALAAREKTRIDGVNRTFRVLTASEIAIAAGALVAGGIGLGLKSDATVGAATGIGVEALVTLLCDVFAFRRARRYAADLAAFLGG